MRPMTPNEVAIKLVEIRKRKSRKHKSENSKVKRGTDWN